MQWIDKCQDYFLEFGVIDQVTRQSYMAIGAQFLCTVWLLASMSAGLREWVVLPDLLFGSTWWGCVVLAGFCICHAWETLGGRNSLAFFTVTLLGSWMAEAVGVATCWPFGCYQYTDKLGIALADVPLLIPLAWSMMLYPSYSLAWNFQSMSSSRSLSSSFSLSSLLVGFRLSLLIKNNNIPTVSLIGALLMTGWAVPMDPIMVLEGHWQWLEQANGAWFGTPLLNYVGWFGTSYLLLFLSQLLFATPHQRPFAGHPLNALFCMLPALAFLGMGLFFLPTVRTQSLLLSLSSLFFMIAPSLLLIICTLKNRPTKTKSH